MPDYKDIRRFSAGLNTDDDIHDIGPDEYVDGLNFVSGVTKSGAIVKMKGNVIVPYTLPSGRNKCIGALRDIKRNAVIYFLWNEVGNHSILHYFCTSGVIEPIFQPFNNGTINFTTDFLGLTEFNKIHSANILDDILTWTDNNVSPRKINIKRAKDFMNQLTPSSVNTPYDNLIATGTTAQKLQFIESIKYVPFRAPTILLGYDPARKTNLIRGKIVQSMYRYIYDDKEPSRWGTGSFVSLPYGEENITGLFSTTIANNYMECLINTGHPTVTSIEMAFRFENTGVWQKIDQPIKKYDEQNQRIIPDFTTYSFRFYNDSVLVAIPVEELVNNYDAIPRVAKTQEIIDGNRLAYGNNLEGYINPTLDISIDAQLNKTDMGTGEIDTFKYTLDVTNYLLIPMNIGSLTEGCVVHFFANYAAPDSEFTLDYTVTANDLLNYPYNLQESLYQAILGSLRNGVGAGSVNKVASYTFMGTDYVAVTIDNASLDNLIVIVPTVKLNSYKHGAFHIFGFLYQDIEGRDGGVVVNDSTTAYMPYLPEHFTTTEALDNQYAYRGTMRFTINHQPPVWAHQYQILYARNNLRKYTQFALKGAIAFDSYGNYILDCTYIINYITSERVITSVDFQIEEGDRIRFISNATNYCQTYVETTVLAFDSTTNKLTVSSFDINAVTNGMTIPTLEGAVCELFHYKADTDNLPYFEISEVYDVLNPGTSLRAHSGNIQSQNVTTSLPAVVLLLRGDSYIYRRYFNTNQIDTMIESDSFSDYYRSNDIDISRVHVVNNLTEKRYEQGIRHGGRYFPDTNTNNLLSFNADDFINLDTRYGPINKICTVGFVLKSLQTKKNTSIYINRNMIFTADGSTQITQSDSVFANINPSEQDYGCIHPESVCVDDRHMYFYDVYNGVFVQDSANGMFPISDYKAKTYFINISEQVKDQDNIFVYTQIDNRNEYINVCFADENGSPVITSQTICFSLADNRWKTRTSYIPDYFASNALVFVAFKNGALYLHNENETRCEFFGVQYPETITFVSNVDPLKVKVFDSEEIYSNKVWTSPEIGDIRIQANDSYPLGMSSRLLENKFRFKEGVSYTSFIRDALTPNAPSQSDALLSGRKLRGEVLTQTLQNTHDGEVILYSVIVLSTGSDMSK